MVEAHKPVQLTRITQSGAEPVDALIIVEKPVSLTVNGEIWLSFSCTPVDLEALAVGFLFNEGLIAGIKEVASVRVCSTGENVDVWLEHAIEKPEKWERTSGCTGGLTRMGEHSIQPVKDGFVLSPSQVYHLVEQLFEAQSLYRESGGVHTSALSDGNRICVTAEDIGRHNTLDKIAGRCLLEQIWPEVRILLTTGRVSSEMLEKAARIGAAIVISRTSPSSLSVQLAEQLDITLIGYARRNRFNVYSHSKRIMEKDPQVSSIRMPNLRS